MEYDEFELYVRRERGGFTVEAREEHTGGRPRARLKQPYDEAELDALLRKMEWRLCLEAGGDEETCAKLAKAAGVAPGATEEFPSYEEVGEKLFSALLAGEVGRRLKESRTRLDGKTRGLRLRLLFDSSDPEHLGPLAAHPWELLWERGRFLAHQPSLPLVRCLDEPGKKRDLAVPPPLRVLLVAANPVGLTRLDLGREIGKIRQALRKLNPNVEVLRPKRATLAELRREVRNGGIHVVHFMGHGGFLDEAGHLEFENEDRSRDVVPAERFANALQDPDLRLVVLTSCKGAELPRRHGLDPYRGVATILNRRGLPAVVAMQFSISDPGAIAFSEEFYRALAEGRPVEEAVVEGRLALERKTHEWVTPVLYLKSREGRLVDPALPRAPRSAALRAHGGERLHLGIRTFAEGANRMNPEIDPENLLVLEDCFEPSPDPKQDRRRITAPELWQTRVFPTLREFLARADATRRKLRLEIAAHQSIAFAAGWCLDVKSGLDIAIPQRIATKTEEWQPEDGTEPEPPLWEVMEDVPLDPNGTDVALAVAISQPGEKVVPEVAEWIRAARLPVRRVIPAVIQGGGDNRSVRGGAHALALAERLAYRARIRRPEERGGRLHVFGAAPNAFFFYLGQLSVSFGPLVLYEYNFGGESPDYWPSVVLPPQRA